MAKKGEVSVDLRLSMAAFRKELRAAVAEMRKSLSFRVDAKDAAADVARIGESFAKVARQAREARKAVSEVAKVRPGVTFTETGRSRIRNPFQSAVDADAGGYGTASGAFRQTQMNAERRARLEELRAARREGLRGFNAQDYYGNRGAFAPRQIGGPVANQVQPNSSVTPSAYSPRGGANSGSALQVGAQVGSILTGLRASFGLFRTAINESLYPLRMFATFVSESVERGRNAYVGALRSGMGLEQSVQRSMLARVIGVGEDEVYAYGDAVNYTNKRVAAAAKQQADTATAAAEAAIEFRALKENLSALKSDLLDKQSAKSFGSKANEAANVARMVVAGFKSFFSGGSYKDAVAETNKFSPPPGKDENGRLAPPAMSVDRMQASPWERMGLVLGGQGAADYARQTANNTRRIADFLEKQAADGGRAGADRVRLRATPRTNTP